MVASANVSGEQLKVAFYKKSSCQGNSVVG